MNEKQSLKVPVYQVDAFTEKSFTGNPAGVCLLKENLEDKILQSIAAEMNLSETAFVYPLGGDRPKDADSYSLRWFTPTTEVPLCGHATLATAAVLFSDVGVCRDSIAFETLSGTLIARREGKAILLDFPADGPARIDPPVELLRAIGIAHFINILYGRRTKMLLIHLSDEESVRKLNPDFRHMTQARTREVIIGVIVTSPGSPPHDFISRFFAPWVGVDEDPVTGSAHTVLAPYWSRIVGKKEMMAYQASHRGGTLKVRTIREDRIDLVGNAIIVMKGEFHL